jgi:hypothetical protein
MILGSLGVVMVVITGRDPAELQSLKEKIEILKSKNQLLIEEKDNIEKNMRILQSDVIQNLSHLISEKK